MNVELISFSIEREENINMEIIRCEPRGHCKRTPQDITTNKVQIKKEPTDAVPYLSSVSNKGAEACSRL